MKTLVKKLSLSLLAICASSSVFAQMTDCDNQCLTDIARQYMSDVTEQDYSKLPWGDLVRYTENNVAMMIGDGFWGAGPSTVGDGIYLPDAQSGNVVWWGITGEHGQLGYHGLRLKITDRQITEVESYIGRQEQPDPFAPTTDYKAHKSFSNKVRTAESTERERMVALVDGWFNSLQLNDGKVFTDIGDDCARISNGVNMTHGDYWAAEIVKGCKAQLAEGLYKPVDRVRARRYPVVNEETGVVVALTLEDHAVRYVDYQSKSGKDLKVEIEYPNTIGRLELFKIVDGEITRIEGVSVFLPYYIHSLWQ